jgi:hypothetical protein
MPGLGGVPRLWAGFALLGAGLVHLAVVREHLAESSLHGGFFAVVGGTQVMWAVATMSRTAPPLPRTMSAVQAGLVVLWLASRTTGLPVPPEPWTPEAVGVVDAVAVTLEVLAVLATVTAVVTRKPSRGRTPRPARILAGTGAGALLVAAMTTPALAATDAGRDARPHGHSHSLGT